MTSSRFDFFDGTLMEFLAVICGGLVAGTLDALDGVIAFSTQGLNLIQGRWKVSVRWRLSRSGIVAAAVYALASPWIPALRKNYVTFDLPDLAGRVLGPYYVVLPLSAVGPSAFKPDLF